MDLYLLRHGKAQEHSLNVSGDTKRRLTEEGKKDIDCIGKAIKNLDVLVDDIFSSPLVRAKQTADIVAKHVQNRNKPIKIWDELKPEIDIEVTTKKLISLNPDSCVLLVGHEPHLTSLISVMISSEPSLPISLKKGGLAHVRCTVAKSTISGSLRSIMTPKQLKKLC